MSNILFTITYCGSCGYRGKALNLAAELETKLDESARLFQSSGGLFEVQFKDKLIYSKKATGRFPAKGEVLRILAGLEKGLPLEEAQLHAAKGIPPLPSFMDWLSNRIRMKRQTSQPAEQQIDVGSTHCVRKDSLADQQEESQLD